MDTLKDKWIVPKLKCLQCTHLVDKGTETYDCTEDEYCPSSVVQINVMPPINRIGNLIVKAESDNDTQSLAKLYQKVSTLPKDIQDKIRLYVKEHQNDYATHHKGT